MAHFLSLEKVGTASEDALFTGSSKFPPDPSTSTAYAVSAALNMTRMVSISSMEYLGEVCADLHFIDKEAEAEPRESPLVEEIARASTIKAVVPSASDSDKAEGGGTLDVDTANRPTGASRLKLDRRREVREHSSVIPRSRSLSSTFTSTLKMAPLDLGLGDKGNVASYSRSVEGQGASCDNRGNGGTG